MKIILFILPTLITFLIFANSPVIGAGSSDDDNYDSAEVVDQDYLNGKEQAYNGKYKAAIVFLKKSIANDPKNADAFNMLGYSNRKLGKNEEAFKYYNKALSLDPRHRGTHEYIGRLYLNLSQPDKAKMHLDKLDSICFSVCDEYVTLEEAIKDFKKTKAVSNY